MAAKYITAIRTEEGPKQIDFNHLANKPTMTDYAKAKHTHTEDEIPIPSISQVIYVGNIDPTDDENILLWVDSVNGVVKYREGAAFGWKYATAAFI